MKQPGSLATNRANAGLNVWVVASGEPTSLDGNSPRLLRTGLLARQLIENGHTVTWWTAQFDHRTKRQRQVDESAIHEGVDYRFLRSRGYAKNVSLARILDHRDLGREFSRRASVEPNRPDVIIASYPPIELAAAAMSFATSIGCPSVIDVRDLWPDVFEHAVPSVLRPVVGFANYFYRRKSARALRQAESVWGITDRFVSWGVALAGRQRRATDLSFPLVSGLSSPNASQRDAARAVVAGDAEPVLRVVFAGTVGRQFDFEPILTAAAAMSEERVRFIVAGDGEGLSALRARAVHLPNVEILGWLDHRGLEAVLATADVGIAPYANTWDFQASIPNKIVEYLAMGLPVLACLEGEVAQLLEKEYCGVPYRSGSGSDLIAQLRWMLANPAHLRVMEQNALGTHDSLFRSEAILARMVSAIESLAGARRGGGA